MKKKMEMNVRAVFNELKVIREEVRFIKKNMVTAESFLTAEDHAAIVNYRKEKKSGKLISHDKLKRQLGL